MTQPQHNGVENIKSTTREVLIKSSNRLYSHDVRSVFEDDELCRVVVSPSAVDLMVMKIANVIHEGKSDEVVMAIGIVFVLIMKRFRLNLMDYLTVIQNFLYRARDRKLGCHTMERMLNTLYKDHLIRYERVDFGSKAKRVRL